MTNLVTDYNSLSKKIQEIAIKYFNSRKEINSLGGFLNPNNIDIDNPFSIYIEKVQHAYESLTDIERAIINNDFFYQNYPKWWEGYYKRSTYYRYKSIAMKKFIEVFENE